MRQVAGDIQRAFRENVADRVARIVAGRDSNLRTALAPADPRVLAVDWTGLPGRVVTCLGRDAALQFLDRPEGREWQEEYLEWSVRRADDGTVTRVDLTTEFADYWRLLARSDPELALETLSEFAERTLGLQDVYGSQDISSRIPAELEKGFLATALAPGADLRLCCLTAPFNTLSSLIGLVAVGAQPWLGTDADGTLRPATADEIAAEVGPVAALGRRSDPLLLEVLARTSAEGRLVALDDPTAVGIGGVETSRLVLPDGSPFPEEWLEFGRPAGGQVDGSRSPPLYQRLTIAIPDDAGIRLGEVIDTATEEQIRWGGQVADLVQLTLRLCITAPGAVKSEPRVVKSTRRGVDCSAVIEAEAATGAPAR